MTDLDRVNDQLIENLEQQVAALKRKLKKAEAFITQVVIEYGEVTAEPGEAAIKVFTLADGSEALVPEYYVYHNGDVEHGELEVYAHE